MPWAIIRESNGELIRAGLAEQPVPEAGTFVIRQPANPNFTWSVSKRGWEIATLTVIRAQLIDAIKTEAENRKMGFLTAGGAKKAEYAAKRAEVAFWDSLGGSASAALTAFKALAPTMQAAKFAYGIADAAAFGDTLAAAIERFRAGMNGAAKVPSISAVEAKACAAIRAATTIAAAQAAAAAAVWPN